MEPERQDRRSARTGRWKPAIVLVVVPVVLIVAAHLPVARQQVLEYGRGYLRASQNLEVEAEDLDYNLFALSASLRGVSVRRVGSESLPPFLTAQEVALNLRFSDLLFGRLTLEQGRIEQIAFRMVVDEEGNSNLPPSEARPDASTPSEPDESSLPLFIEDLQASGPVIEIEDRQRGFHARVPDWTLNVRGERSGSEQTLVLASSQTGLVAWQGRELALSELAVGLALEPGALRLRRAAARLGGTSVSIAGEIAPISPPVFNLTVDASVDLRDVAAVAGLTQKMEGRAELRASISQSFDDLAAAGTWSGENLTLGELRDVTLSARASWENRTRNLALDDIVLRSSAGGFQGRTTLAFGAEGGVSALAGRFENIDLMALTRALDLPVQIASHAGGELDMQWPALEIRQATGTAAARLRPAAQEPSHNVLPVSGSISLAASGERMLVSTSSLRAADVELAGAVTLESLSEVSGEVRGSIARVSETASALERFLGRQSGELLRASEADGSLMFQSNLGGTIESPEVSLLLDGSGLQIANVRGMALHAAADYREPLLTLHRAELTWQEQTVSARGEVGLGNEQPSLDLDVRAESLSIQEILTALGNTAPVAGRLDFSADVSGDVASPAADVVAEANDLTAYGEPLGRLSLAAQLLDQQVEVSQFTLEKPSQPGPGGTLRGAGRYGLEDGRYSFVANGDGLNLESFALPGQVPVRGMLALSANGSGTLESPSLIVQIDASSFELAERPLGSVSLFGNVAGDVATLRLQAPQLNLESNARIRLREPFPAEFDVSTDQTDLSLLKIPGWKEETVGGVLSSEIRGTGEISDWRGSDVTAQVKELRVNVAGQEIRSEGTLQARLSDGVVEVTSARVAGPGSEMSVTGSLPIARSTTAGDLRILATLDTAQLMRLVPQSEGLQASGNIAINASLRGSFEQLDPSLELSVRDGSFSRFGTPLTLGDIGISARTQAESLVVEANASFLSGRIAAEGELPLGMLPSMGLPLRRDPEGGPARLRLQVQDLQLESMGLLPEDVAGQVGLTLEVAAPRFDLDALQANAQFDLLRLRLVDVEVQQTEPARLSLRDGLLNVDSFRLGGPGTSLELQGQAQLTEPASLDLNLAGNADIGILTLLRERLQAAGDTRIQLAVRGTLAEPQFSGTATLSQGRFALSDPPLQAEQVEAQVRVIPGRVTVERLGGSLNGGDVEASGAFGYSGTELTDVSAELSVRDLFLSFPEGLRTSSEADIRLTSSGEQIVVGGEVRILEGSFRENLQLESELLAFLRSGQSVVLEDEGRSPLLSRLRYNLPLRTLGPIVVDNNLARLSMISNLRLVGTYYRPSVTGRLSLEEGGQLHLAENDYVIDTGTLDFSNVNRIEPSVNIVARTEASGYDVELRVAGGAADIETTLTSEPPLPEPDIVSVLVTGRTLEEAQRGGVNVAREQGLSYLTGRVGSRLSERAQETTGLSQVRIEPNLIAAESDPAVRLTLGQNLTRQLRLIYSMNLANSGDQIYVAEYEIGRRFNARGVKQTDNTYRFGFRHEVQAGGARQQPGQTRLAQRTVGEIAVTGNPVLEPRELLDQLALSTGDRFDFLKLRAGLDRIEEQYRREQRLEARVRLQQERTGSAVNLRLNIESGPQVEFVFEGCNVPSRIRDRVAEEWQRGVFEAQRMQDAQTTLRRWLVEENYLDATVEQDIQNPSSDLKRVLFLIQPGVQYRNRQIVWEGVSAFPPSALEEFLGQQELLPALYLQPARVVDSLASYYRQRGYFDAEAQPPRHEREPEASSARVLIAIQEGPRYNFGDPELEGNRAFSDTQLRAAIPMRAGLPYDPEMLASSIARLEELYWGAGYNNVVIEFSEQREAPRRELRYRFRIMENQQDVVESVEIRGNDAVNESFIRQRIPFASRDVFDSNRAGEARTNLYKTGAFTLVEFDTEPIPGGAAQGPQRPLRVLMNVQEVRPYQLRYGGFFDTERGPGAILDFENRNTLGSARVVGFRTRYDSEIREARGYFGQPLRLGPPSTISVTGFRRREIMAREFLSDFLTDRTGFSLQQEYELWNNWLFNYGYRFERTHTFDREPDPHCPLPLDDPFCRFDDSFNIAPLTSSVSLDRRDNPLDATRGMFTSHSLEFAPGSLGSDLRFLRYFGQFYRYQPLGRPRFTYAGGVRVGLGRGFGGQGLILSERFFSGGGTSLRGFEQDTAGPKDFLGDPAGGEALLIVNNELRFPLISLFEGVAFLDLGNVYSTVRDFDPFEVRKAAGVGLRVRTPYFLLRLDYGHKLDRQAGESPGQLFFSIGQAF